MVAPPALETSLLSTIGLLPSSSRGIKDEGIKHAFAQSTKSQTSEDKLGQESGREKRFHPELSLCRRTKNDIIQMALSTLAPNQPPRRTEGPFFDNTQLMIRAHGPVRRLFTPRFAKTRRSVGHPAACSRCLPKSKNRNRAGTDKSVNRPQVGRDSIPVAAGLKP